MLKVHGLQRPGLMPFSLQLQSGECLAVQGPSGSGKTLLLRTLADLDPNQGEVTLEGVSRESLSGPEWRRQVVYVPSESGWWDDYTQAHFPNWTAAIPLLKRLLLTSSIGERQVQQLSTGERQRLALIRALLLEPRILLLDEPTSGLDKAAAVAVEALLGERLATGIGVIWVTHDPAQARRLARRGLFLEAGRVREQRL